MAKSIKAKLQAKVNKEGKGAVVDIREKLDALAHARECTGSLPDGTECTKGEGSESPERWHDESLAYDAIVGSQYGILVRSGWYAPGKRPEQPGEYLIVLGGGGPSSRLVGDLEDGEPSTSRYEYREWATPWITAELTPEQEETLVEFAGYFNYRARER